MSTLKSLIGALAVSVGMATGASAVTIIFEGVLVPESGPPATGTGTARVTFDTDLSTMRVETTWSGTSGTSTVAHIHCCTTSPGVGNAGVATQVPSFAGFPVGVTGGTYDNTFDMTVASSFNPAFVTANGGTLPAALNVLITGLTNDRGYLNIHTSTFGGGEIRARLVLIPEPTTAILLGMGLVLLAGRRQAIA